MTIHRDWIAAWKKNHPSAFSRAIPQGTFPVVFIDGQIKLMKNAEIKTWKNYIERQFMFSVRRYFQNGAETVVVAFDDYEHVPPSKGMTQMKRRKHVPAIDEPEHAPLPPIIPYNWDAAIMNRTFKSKVIALVCERLPEMIRLTAGQKLIIDYRGQPAVYTMAGLLDRDALADSFAPMGEADVKCTRYCPPGTRMLVDAIDGDYLPITLMHVQRCEQNLRHNDPRGVPQITVLRMECKVTPSQRGGGSAGGAVRVRPRTYEYVNVNMVYESILRHIDPLAYGIRLQKAAANQAQQGLLRREAAVQQAEADSDSDKSECDETEWGADDSAGAFNRHSIEGHEMRMLAGLIAMTGCDYTKGLAQISPTRVWDLLPSLWRRVQCAYDPPTESFDVQRFADLVVSKLYCTIFSRHVGIVPPTTMPASKVMELLKNRSLLAAATRARLPSSRNIECIAKNANWVIAYWRCPADGKYPNPLQPCFGFAVDSRGLPQWEDELD